MDLRFAGVPGSEHGRRVRHSRSTSSTAPTSCSATTSRVPSHVDADGDRGRRDARRARLGAGDARTGRDARRRRDRPRHRIVPQRSVARLQDRRRASTPELLAQFPIARGRARGARRHGVGDGRVRGRRRARVGRRGVAATTTASTGCSSAPPTRTSASACEDPKVRAARPPPGPSVIDEAGVRETLRRRAARRSPTTSRSSATPPTAFPGLPGGARSRPPRCSPATSTSRRSPTTRGEWEVDVRGAAKLAATLARRTRGGGAVPRPRHAAHSTPTSAPSTTGSGAARPRNSRRGRNDSAPRTS